MNGVGTPGRGWSAWPAALALLSGCAHRDAQPQAPDGRRYLSQPIVAAPPYTADPSAHVFGGRLYVYVSHDIDGPALPDVAPFRGSHGNSFRMRDYLALSLDRPGRRATVSAPLLDIAAVPWATRQLWAPDVAYRNGRYLLYFPAKDRDGAFRIGVATASAPLGPFVAAPQPIAGSYSIDPAVFTDIDDSAYLYFGGLSGGQLQKVRGGRYDPAGPETDDRPGDAVAFGPRMARLTDDGQAFAEPVREIAILNPDGSRIRREQRDRAFFEAAWLHRRRSTYYLSYSTGDTHLIAYATATSPYGPFTWRGTVLKPVQGWTTHHSIVEHRGRWWLFYADSQLSGKTHLRNVKVAPLVHRRDGSIVPIDPFRTPRDRPEPRRRS